jgi:hypothetical protein
MMVVIYRDARGPKLEPVVVVWGTEAYILIMLFLKMLSFYC